VGRRERGRNGDGNQDSRIRHCRQTGTAQVVSLGKEGSEFRDHSWFVSYAPAYKPEIACVALIENAGLGSRFGAPSVRAVYDVYYNKKHGQPDATKANIAMKVR